MYLSHYNLEKIPFKTNPDPRFIWLGESHREALAVLRYGVLKRDGFLVLTGEIGTGKTTLVRHLLHQIKHRAVAAFIPIPNLEPLDFFNLLSEEFKLKKKYDKEVDFLIDFKRFLLDTHALGRKVFLIIDEAQHIGHELLEKIRLLSNLELDNVKLLNVFFVGQREFEKLVKEEKNKAIRQRIATAFDLKPLTETDTVKYIAHRLGVAGARAGLFTPGASSRIYQISEGIPRLINSICDCALLSGYIKGRKTVDSSFVEECQLDLRLALGR